MLPARTIPVTAVLIILARCGGSSSEPTPPPPPPPPTPVTPVVEGIRPSSVSQGTTRDVVVAGSGFEAGARVEFTRAGAVEPRLAATVTAVAASALTVRVAIAAQAPLDAYGVTVTNSSGRTGSKSELMLVETVAPDELATIGAAGVVTVILSNGAAYGIVSGGCATLGIGVPVRWEPSGTVSQLSLPANAGCDVQPLRALASELLGRGNPSDANSLNYAVSWTGGGQGAAEGVTVPSPPLGQRYFFQQVGPDGTYIGWATDTTNPASRKSIPSIWRRNGGWAQLQIPPTMYSCHLENGNADGAVVGWCQQEGQNSSAWPIYWAGASAAPVSLPLPPGAVSGQSLDINASNVIVGFVSPQGAPLQAVRWTPTATGWQVDPLVSDGGQEAVASNINDSGWIAGQIGTNPNPRRAVLWSPAGELRLLGRLDRQRVCAPVSIAQSAPNTPPLLGGKCFREELSTYPVIWRP